MGTRNPIGGPFKRRVRRPIPMGGVRRPVRWIEGNSAQGIEPIPQVSAFSFTPTLDTSAWPTAGGTELINGDSDLEWMDRNEVTVERIVGDITTAGFYVDETTGQFITQYVYRMGILVVEEVEDIGAWVPPSLFTRENLEEFEWMWLYQGLLQAAINPIELTTGGSALFFGETVHVDLHVRRKIGKKDHLVLLGQFGTFQLIPGDLATEAVHQLRVLFKA